MHYLSTLMQLNYPYSPYANWRIAVSRKFNHPFVDKLYNECILPVLETEGHVLGCEYSAETLEAIDYWQNMFCMYLEISDIHVLIDIDRSASMEFEFRKSKSNSTYRYNPALLRSFELSILNTGTYLIPIKICLQKGVKTKISPIRAIQYINIDDNYSSSDIYKQVSKAIKAAKKARLLMLLGAIKYEEFMVRFDECDFEIEQSLIKMTELAKIFIANENVITIANAVINSELSNGFNSRIEEVNKNMKWELDVYKGDIELPKIYSDKIAYLKNIYRNNLEKKMANLRLFDIEPPYWLLDTLFAKVMLHIVTVYNAKYLLKK